MTRDQPGNIVERRSGANAPWTKVATFYDAEIALGAMRMEAKLGGDVRVVRASDGVRLAAITESATATNGGAR